MQFDLYSREFGTYSKNDVIFLLKDISDLIVERNNEERERKIQNGTHYSEMIPIEYEVSAKYMDLYREKLEETKEKLAFAIGVMCEKILRNREIDSEYIDIKLENKDENFENEKKIESKECVRFQNEKETQKTDIDIVLVSLARAGTPIGILAKRYIQKRYGINLPHYTIS
ncbi:MAG: hypothetical protein LBR30_05465, partial [Clostridioides sp.]|nr:hypothetical protein [Clostridioides sp.]